MIKGSLFLFVLVIISFGETITQCRYDSECGSDECCYYHEGPLIVSKRDIVFPTFISPHQGGWCEKYLTLGAHCNPFDKLNGHCSCGPNLTCTYFPFTSPPGTRLVQRSLRPGNYLCHPI